MGKDDTTEEATSEPTARSRRRRPLLVVLVVVALGTVIVGEAIRSGSGSTTATSSPTTFSPATATGEASPNVVYTIDGTASAAELTLTTPNGQTQISATLPLSVSESIFAGSSVYISAQNDGNGSVTCHISVKGVEVTTKTASGAFQIATCQGTA